MVGIFSSAVGAQGPKTVTLGPKWRRARNGWKGVGQIDAGAGVRARERVQRKAVVVRGVNCIETKTFSVVVQLYTVV